MKLIMCLIICTLFAVSTSYAAEVTAPTGNVAEVCYLSFDIQADSGFTDTIAIKLTDITDTSRIYGITLDKESEYGKNQIYSIVANTTYTIEIDYPNDSFMVIGADGQTVTSCHATTQGLILEWEIIDINTDIDTNVDLPTDLLTSHDVLKNFHSKAGFIENNDAYKLFLKIYSTGIYKKYYLEEEGKEHTEETWNDKSIYEQALYTMFFSMPKLYMSSENRQENMSSKDAFKKKFSLIEHFIINSVADEDDNKEAIVNAVYEVVEWHWANWESSRTLVNLFDEADIRVIKEQVSVKDDKDTVLEDNDFYKELTEGMTETEKKELQNDISSFYDTSGINGHDELATPLVDETIKTGGKLRRNFVDNLMSVFVPSLIMGILGAAYLFLRNRKDK